MLELDIEAYISSGILEAYVLGTVSDKERREVECMASIHEEIGAELQAIREAMERYATMQSIAPPAALKDRITHELDNHVVSIHRTTGETVRTAPVHRRSNVYMIAAAIALLLTATFAVMFLQNRAEIDAVKKDLAAIDDSRHELEIKIGDLRSRLAFSESQLAFLQDSATVQVSLLGITTKSPDAYARVFWNKISGEAYLKVFYLPPPPAGKQYQLWAIAGGKPLDMGVFTFTRDMQLQKVKNMSASDAFAITLEPEGGSVSPTLTEMFVIGQV